MRNMDDISDFKCKGCGACCMQEGYVRLRRNEPDIIAEFLGMDVYAFINEYTILTRDRQTLSLTDGKGTSCIFLEPSGCRIHPVKPAQCKDFPHKWKFSDFKSICQWAKEKNKKS